MTAIASYIPDHVSPPGETIADLLDEHRLSREDLRQHLDIEHEAVDRLLSGDLAIDIALAEKLSAAIGSSADFWLNRERRYRTHLDSLNEAQSEAGRSWMASLPFREMVRYGWIEDRTSTSCSGFISCLRFFGASNLTQWAGRYEQAISRTAFRRSTSRRSTISSVAAWLRQGELLANSLNSPPFDAMGFRAALQDLRSLTRRREPEVFVPDLQRRCLELGVSVVVVRTPRGCPASGATRILENGRALLMLSFRYLSDDQFWFTFFHEAGHLLLHSRCGLILELLNQQPDTPEEIEANEFAQYQLVPRSLYGDMLELPADARAIIRFAMQAGTCPGVIVGQLQHRGVLRHNQFNQLKRRYRWKD